MIKILFVCTGNTCRSPMAETLANKIFKEKNLDIKADSAGISVNLSSGASENSVSTMRDYNIDLSGHKAKNITKKIFDENDFILTMTKQHKIFLEQKFFYANNKIFTLSKFACNKDYDIIDPFGCDLEIYKRCANEILDFIKIIADKFSKQE